MRYVCSSEQVAKQTISDVRKSGVFPDDIKESKASECITSILHVSFENSYCSCFPQDGRYDRTDDLEAYISVATVSFDEKRMTETHKRYFLDIAWYIFLKTQ